MPVVYAQILGTSEEHDTFPSLLVSVDEFRLLFNAGEGIQRLSNEHGIKISKVKHLLMGSLSWPAWGGAPDLMFYFSDSGKLGLNIYGPTPLQHFVMINHYFFWKPHYLIGLHEMKNDSILNYPSKGVFAKSFIIQNKSFDSIPSKRILNPCYEDAINMRKQIDEELKEGTQSSHDSHTADDVSIPTPERGFKLSRNHKNVESSLYSLAINRPKYINTPKIDQTVLVYCVHTPEISGKFDMAAAAKLGVPKGPFCGRLVKGETVELPNGKKVSPQDCVGPSTPGPIIIVVTCPSADYVESLTTHPDLEWYITESKSGRIIHVFHVTPDDVILSAPYQQWISKFGPKTHHIAMNRNSKYTKEKEGEIIDLHQSPYTDSLHMQMQLHKLDPLSFSLPPPSLSSPDLPPKLIRAEYLMKVHLQPLGVAGLDRSDVPQGLKLSEVSVSPDLGNLIADYNSQKRIAHTQHEAPEYLKNVTEEEMEIVFLGTGAAIPFKLRSVTAIFVNFFARGGMLLDTGESAFTQLCRKYGDKIDDILINLKCIWISHKHADHHLSLPSILFHRQKAYERAKRECEAITIIAPYYISGYLTELSWFHPLKFNVIHNSVIKSKSHQLSDFFRETFGLKSFYNIRVPHIVDSYGLIMESVNGWKLVFSGDTSPCEQLAKEGEGATVVIHEATMENALQAEAEGRGHSSTLDAILGRKMGCYRTILTHFSARHHHFPVPDFVDKTYEDVFVAFDLMTVNLKHLPHLPLLIPSIVQMYKEDIAKCK